MKKSMMSAFSLIVLSLLLWPGTTVRAEQNRFYIVGDVGGTHARDVRLREFFGIPIAPNSTIELDPGIRFGFRGGYGLTDWLSAEVETGISANNIDTITGATEANGSIANVPLLLNLRLHAPTQYRVSPYIGGGFGLSSTILDGDDIIIGPVSYRGTSADAVLACQGFAGLRFAINDHMGLSVEYRFLHAESSNMEADVAIGTPTDRVKLGRTQTHSVSVAFDVQF